MHRQVSLLKDQLRDLRMSNESTEARLMDQSQRLGRVFFLHDPPRRLIVTRPGGGREARRDGYGRCRAGACKYQGSHRGTS